MRSIAQGEVRISSVIGSDTIGASPLSKAAALHYLQSIRHRTAGPEARTSGTASRLPADEDQLPVLETAARALAVLVSTPAASRSARGESWYRIHLTPDIELSVRGDFDTEQLAQLHRIGDSLRTLLTKGPAK